MKRMISMVLAFCLLLPLLGCDEKQDSILFYYARKDILYGQEDAVIASEVREAIGHEDDLTYLLMLYLEGPHSQELFAPFPSGTALEGMEAQEGHLSVILSDEFQALQGIDHTIACTCIAYTCFANSDYVSVTIRSSAQDASGITLTRNNVALEDTSAVTAPN